MVHILLCIALYGTAYSIQSPPPPPPPPPPHPPHTHKLFVKKDAWSARSHAHQSETTTTTTTKLASVCVVLLFLAQSGTAQEQDSLPANIPQVTIEGRNSGTCPSAAVTEQALNSTKETIQSILRDTVVPFSTIPPHAHVVVLDSGKIAHLDMSDPD